MFGLVAQDRIQVDDFAGVQAAGEILDQVGEAGVGQGRWPQADTHDAFSCWTNVPAPLECWVAGAESSKPRHTLQNRSFLRSAPATPPFAYHGKDFLTLRRTKDVHPTHPLSRGSSPRTSRSRSRARTWRILAAPSEMPRTPAISRIESCSR